MTARLRLQEFLARAGDRVNQGTRQGVGDAIGGLDRLGAEQRRQEQKQLLAAKLTAAGIMGGTNPAAPRTVDRPGTVEMTRPETLEEKAARFFKTVGRDMPSVQRDLGEGGVRGLLAQAQGSQVDAARVRNIDARTENEGRKGEGIEAATVGKQATTAGTLQKTAVDGLKQAVGVVADEMTDLEEIDPESLSGLINAKTEDFAAAFPDAKPEVIRGMVAEAVYDVAKAKAKTDFERERIIFSRTMAKAKFDAARKDAATRSLTTQEINILGSQKKAVKKLSELKKLSEDPTVRKEWKNFSAGANEIARVTGQFIDGFINLDEYEAAQRVLSARLKGQGKTMEFLRRMRADLFTVARAKNGPGVMTDKDLNFWLPILVDPSMSPGQFDNAMSRLIETSTREYVSNIKVFKDIARTLPGEFAKDLDIEQPTSTIKAGVGVPGDTFLGAKDTLDMKTKVGEQAARIDVLAPGSPVQAFLDPDSMRDKSTTGETGRAFEGANIPIANNLDEATAIEAQTRQAVINIRENPSAYSKEETAAAAHNFNRATQQRKNMSGGQLGNIAGPSASTLGPRVDALRKKIQGN